jgi:hypothetical protein
VEIFKNELMNGKGTLSQNFWDALLYFVERPDLADETRKLLVDQVFTLSRFERDSRAERVLAIHMARSSPSHLSYYDTGE